MAPEFRILADRVRPFTMTSDEKMYALYGALQHVVKMGVLGDVVECGVWRGGSAMLAALTLARLGDTSRTIWLYDTYEGMSEPTRLDVNRFGARASDLLDNLDRSAGEQNTWAFATLDDVRANMQSTGYPRIRFVKGKVEDTIPGELPERISLLRLDTDWYESTRHELVHLWPRLEQGGVLILDDYGWWDGARRAVDEYRLRELLIRVGTEGARIAVKT
jgi:hypothetical protein